MDHAKQVCVKRQRKLHYFGVTFVDGFTSNADSKDSKDYHDNFLCSNCKKHRKLLDDEIDRVYAAAFTKIHDYYTNPKKKSAFEGRLNLIKESKFRAKDVERDLNSSKTYTKFKLTRKRFPRLKVVCYRLNEIWSVDLADMQQLANNNSGIRYLFVAVDVLSCYQDENSTVM